MTGIEIISHGDAGALQLGNHWLSSLSLEQYAPQLQQWSKSLAAGADLLFYGCDLAQDDGGKALVNQISQLTGADVAASTDLTGNAKLGGNWTLEYTTGTIETASPFTQLLMDTYQGTFLGIASVSGNSIQGSTLSASVIDPNALVPTLSYQWQQSSTGATWSNIAGATTSSLTLNQSQVNQRVRVQASYSTQSGSLLGIRENIFSSATAPVANRNDLGRVTLSGTSAQGSTLTATVDDADGLPSKIDYQWQQSSDGISWKNIKGASGATFTLSQAQVNQRIRIEVAYTDVLGSNENLVSTVTNPIVSTNQLGTLTLGGTTTQNQVLTATLADADGLPSKIDYQWQQSSDGISWKNIKGATGTALTLSLAQVNQQVRVQATYTDALGNSEDLISTVTNPIVSSNKLGTLTLSGIVLKNQVLTATVADADGLPSKIDYQWQQSSDGISWKNIKGASEATFTLSQAQVNQQIRVEVTYTDDLDTKETLLSTATLPVANANDLGTVTLSGTTAQGSTLTATVADGNGLGRAIAYQWQQSSNGSTWTNITGATGTTLTLGQSQVNQRVRVQAIYTDALGSSEDLISTATSSIANINDLGTLTLSGNATQNQVLTATVADGDGLGGAIAYQWQQSNDGISWTTIAGATSKTFSLTQAQVSQRVRAQATYTDALGTSETLLSTATAPVANTNDLGVVTLSGTTAQGSTLTATIADGDGLGGAITYQWQQNSNGNAWSNITDATGATLTLSQSQVNQRVRVQATYTDAFGSSEALISSASDPIANVNDLGTVTLSGIPEQGGTLTANVADIDGLTRVPIQYQWQQSSDNGTTWSNIAGATNQNLTLDSSYGEQQVRVQAIYTDALGGNENVLSLPTALIPLVLESIFTAASTPTFTDLTDGPGVTYELGMKFISSKAGQIRSIRYYKSPSETGIHIGKIWSSTGELLASVTFTNETASGWQQQALSTPLTIAANASFVISVNSNGYYADTLNGFAVASTSGALTAPVGAGVFGNLGLFPTQVYQNSNYYRDVVFGANAPVNNKPGTVTLSGTPTQNQTLTATVADQDGLTGVSIAYQWQQSSNGTTWTNIAGATSQTLKLEQAQVNTLVRVSATYTDGLGTSENVLSSATPAVVNVNDAGLVILKGSATNGSTLEQTVLDADGLTGVTINYQWQQLVSSTWTNIAGATTKSLSLGAALIGQQVRVLANYIDALGSSENVASSGVSIAAQNAIVLENQKAGTTAWQLTNTATNNEIVGYGDATSINKGEAINLKVSLAQAGQYRLDVYRLGYYGGAGGHLVTSVADLNGVVQAGPTINSSTRLVEYNWNTSYTLQTSASWTTGLYFVKLTNSAGKETYIQFVLRDDGRPADIGFQDAIATAAAYNNYGGYSVYDFNSAGGQRAYQVSFDRPLQYNFAGASEQFNNTLTWEYNMTRWLESQGYDVSYYSNLDVSINPLQLYSQKTFLSVGHDEYWSMEQRNSVEQARDNGTNLAFFSANTAYWQVRYEASSTGQANRVMTVYKDSSGVGSNPSIDPIAQSNPTAATTLFRSAEVNRPENSLVGVGYIGDWGAFNVYNGRDFVISNAADPYYAHTGLQNGDKLVGLVGYEWDGLLNNGLAPAGLVVLSQSPVPSEGLGALGLLPPGTNDTLSNAVRYTAASGAKVFSTGSVQWVWGLDSAGVTNPRVDLRAQQIAVNVFKDMGATPQTPDAGIVV